MISFTGVSDKEVFKRIMMKSILKLAKVVAITITSIAAMTALVACFFQILEKKPKNHQSYGIYEKWIKRPLDAFLSMGALLVFSPILLITAVLVRIKLGSPVLFTQDRLGRNGKIFKLYKFRTMTDERDENGELFPDEVRLTDFGKKLRSTSLDELPELFNLVKGDMAVVGPRPLLVRYLPRYNAHQARRHEVRPGFTGLAQVHGRNAISWEEKFDWDVKYVDHISFAQDVNVLLDTIKTVFRREGISSDTSSTMEEFLGSEDVIK